MLEDNSDLNLYHCEKIGEGGCHMVYATPAGKVIKVPKFLWSVLNTYASHYEDNRIIHKYFGEYVWPTTVIPSTTRSYRIEQPKLPKYSVLDESLLQDDHVRGQFEDILFRNEELYRDKRMSFDFFGLEGIISSSLYLLNESDGKMELKDGAGFKKAIASIISDLLIGKEDITSKKVVSNIVVIEEGGEKRLRIVDCTLMDEKTNNLIMRMVNRTCNYFTKRFMKKCFGKEVLLG